MIKWLLLVGAIASEVTASLSLKGAIENPWLYVLVVGGFVTAFTFLALVLQRGMALGVAYGIWGAMGVAATSALSAVIFDEPFTGLMMFGIGLIIAGVLTIEFGAQAAHKNAPHAENGAT